jgi:hypothetical protein
MGAGQVHRRRLPAQAHSPLSRIYAQSTGTDSGAHGHGSVAVAGGGADQAGFHMVVLCKVPIDLALVIELAKVEVGFYPINIFYYQQPVAACFRFWRH